mmetsp:Transcript_64039/g.118992  ORF Transcript_64039/g.118992 Transcript_64039/m.118992 type:complete len:123 (+) Transcript_64039:88-456(+)
MARLSTQRTGAAGLLILFMAVVAMVSTVSAFVGNAHQRPLLRSTARETQSPVARAALFQGAKVELIEPDEEPEPATYLFGLNFFAENLNGRLAMIAFLALVLIETVLNKPILEILGALNDAL